MTGQLVLISPGAPPSAFPDPETALREPNGLLAVGGDLRPDRLVEAYRRGIFPWYGEGEPIMWWSPDPRAVIFPDELRLSRSLRKVLRRGTFEVRVDTCFAQVVAACAAPRAKSRGTWITPEMQRAYVELHRRGLAHSVECFRDGELVGGLYGVALGALFCGESMFHRVPDASKVALVHLCRMGFELIDAQVPSPFMEQMGARLVARSRFLQMVERLRDRPGPFGAGGA